MHTQTSTPLIETLTDLAATADREGARAADVDLALSSTLFVLGDELRSTAARTHDGSREDAYALLDSARFTVARAMVRLDARERMSATPDPGSVMTLEASTTPAGRPLSSLPERQVHTKEKIMSTIQAPSSTAVLIGIVSTPLTLTKSLPDHIPHISFHLDTAEGRGFNVHADGAAAELAHLMIHRGDHIRVTPERVYFLHPAQTVPDVDVATFDLTLD